MRRFVVAAFLIGLPVASANAQIPVGEYECWFFSRPQMLLNFKITGPNSYTDSEGTRGSYSLGANNQITFRGGGHDGSRAVYKNITPPTVSFIGTSGEAAFCERAK